MAQVTKAAAADTTKAADKGKSSRGEELDALRAANMPDTAILAFYTQKARKGTSALAQDVRPVIMDRADILVDAAQAPIGEISVRLDADSNILSAAIVERRELKADSVAKWLRGLTLITGAEKTLTINVSVDKSGARVADVKVVTHRSKGK